MPVSHWARYKLLIHTQNAPSGQPEHWLLRKQTVGHFSLTASVADIDVVKAAATASTKGNRIVREDVILL
jgi:predicted thioredoxin/glutaredoxin